MSKILAIDDWLSAKEARQLIFYFNRWGEHDEDHLRSLPDSEIEVELARRGYDLDAQMESLQENPHRAVARFENLLVGGTWTIEASEGVTATHSFVVDGIEVTHTEVDDETVVRQAHTADFLAACNARDEAIKRKCFDSFYTALSKGFSSIEAYLTLRTLVHNSRCQDDSQKLNEKRKHGGFVSLDEKLTKWLPLMTGNTIHVETSPGWNDYKYLRDLRNNVVIHPKPGEGFSKLEELADGINRFRYGIAALMFLLHQCFGDRMQSSIIRAMRYPTVRVAEES